MNELATVDMATGEIVAHEIATHDAKALTTAAEGVQYVRLFDRCVALAKAAGKDRATVNKYAEQLVRHVRETGALIGQLPKQRGKRTDKEPGATDATKFYVDSGIAKSTAMRWQSLATHITDTAFDEAIERIKADDESTISLSAFYGIVKAVRRQTKEREREARRDENRAIVEAAPDPVAIGARFTSLVIDPPWDWGDEGDADQLGRARPQYATMPFAAIKALPVDKLADRDAHLYLWITNRSLPKGFELLEAWGFRYITCITWGKPSYGMGNYFRGQTEQVLFGVRGSLSLKRKDVGTLFLAPRGPRGHSSKPAEFYDLIESCSPGPYLEMFARSNRKDWTAWGAEANAT